MPESGSRQYLIHNGDDDDKNDDDDDDDYSCTSVNFQVNTSRFCKEVDVDNNFDMIISIWYRKTQKCTIISIRYRKTYNNLK